MVSLRGEHDLTTAPVLREKTESAIADGVGLVIDLSEAEFIDSSIIGAVLDARKRAGESGIGFAVALGDGEPPVRRVLEVTGLKQNLPVRESREEAVAQVQAGPEAPPKGEG